MMDCCAWRVSAARRWPAATWRARPRRLAISWFAEPSREAPRCGATARAPATRSTSPGAWAGRLWVSNGEAGKAWARHLRPQPQAGTGRLSAGAHRRFRRYGFERRDFVGLASPGAGFRAGGGHRAAAPISGRQPGAGASRRRRLRTPVHRAARARRCPRALEAFR